MYGALGGPAKVEWVREEYRGNGIDLYSLFTVEAERTGSNVTVVSPVCFRISSPSELPHSRLLNSAK